jgi:hypothetical protein
MKSIVSDTEVTNFSDLTLNPAQLAVFLVDTDTMAGHRIYESAPVEGLTYSIDWINKTVTLSDDVPAGKSLIVEVYEVGNGRQLVRSNSQLTPMTIDTDTGYSEILLNHPYQYLETPVVYVNGTKLVYQTDYNIVSINTSTALSTLKILFNQTYDDTVDYISYAVLTDSTTDYNDNHYGYSIPETEVFVYDGSTSDFDLTNFVGGDNADNAIVEINGYRRSSADYSIDTETNRLTVTVAMSADDVVSVTTFNDTQRQYLNTNTSSAITVKPVYTVDNSQPVATFTLTYDLGLSNGDKINIDGLVGATQLNGNHYYVNVLQSYTSGPTTYYPYQLFTDNGLSIPVESTQVDSYISGGYVCKDNSLLTISSTTVTMDFDGSDYTVKPSDPARAWVTINGQRVNASDIRYVNDKLFILTEISSGDGVIATTMVDGATPNESSFIMTVDKNGAGAVYKSTPTARTWLTQDLLSVDDTIHFRDVSLVVNDGTKILNIDGEMIRFTTVDYTANTVSGLVRGALGTGVKDIHKENTYVFGISPDKKLEDVHYFKTWNSRVITSKGDPLQLSNNPAAVFLELGAF